MAREEPGAHAWEYDGPRCVWCGDPEDDERCGCPMSVAAREDDDERLNECYDDAYGGGR